MTFHITKNRKGFPLGETVVTKVDNEGDSMGIAFSILKLREGERHRFFSSMELALLHMDGAAEFSLEGENCYNMRNSLFDESPFALHVSCYTEVEVVAKSEVELAIFQTRNEKGFPAVVYPPSSTVNEHRGEGVVDGASLRYVRTVFDDTNSHPNTELVLGEVVNFPGRWSSYPPHHHPQPELYHYRFDDSRGYGHGELGDDVFKVKGNDTIKILNELDHAQCSAPGYAMYYIWVIRHLPNLRYTLPEFTEEHRWTMSKEAEVWKPKEVEAGV